MSKRHLVIAGAAALSLLLAACGSSSDGDTSTSAAPAESSSSAAPAGKVGVILPDSASSARWETADRKFLTEAFDAAGVESDIQNANGDKTKFATLCDQFVSGGVAVLMIVNLDSETGAARSVISHIYLFGRVRSACAWSPTRFPGASSATTSTLAGTRPAASTILTGIVPGRAASMPPMPTRRR